MSLKRFLQGLPVYDFLNKLRYWREWRRWKSAKSSVVPHYLKRDVVGDYARRYGLGCMVETGTYFGEMVDANKQVFSRIVSVELDDFLFRRAVNRFSGHKHIQIIKGDSGNVLPEIMETLECPALFWLDAHYSGGITALGPQVTPILNEVRSILTHPVRGHVILVDDARLFNGTDGYPTLQEVSRLIENIRGGWVAEVKDDILRIVPREDGSHGCDSN